MIKTAIFVEGQTELIFVREYLLKWFEYSISLDCFNLLKADATTLNPTEYPFPNPTAERHFQIMNVGGDGNVLSRILSRERYFWNQGFVRIIGLRDMYSENYRKLSQGREIAAGLNKKFIDGAQLTVGQNAQRPNDIKFCWSIMEVEAWLLGLYICFEGVDSVLTSTYIQEKLGINLENDDPETTYFHPANEVKRIMELAGRSYGKSKGDINSIMGCLNRENFTELLALAKCETFNIFHSACSED